MFYTDYIHNFVQTESILHDIGPLSTVKLTNGNVILTLLMQSSLGFHYVPYLIFLII